jgi:cytoskeletal protein CcmA (bactofilin family)
MSILNNAKMSLFSLESSWTRGIDADGIKLEGDIFLSSGFHAEGGVRLIGATIAGDLDATDGTVENPKKDALNADRAVVTGSVFLSNFVTEGEVSLVGATIGGDLDAEGATLNNSNGNALSADAIKVTGDIFLTGDFVATGEVRLFNAAVGGNLDATDGTFRNLKSDKNPDATGDALSAEGIRVMGDVFLRDKFVADGEVSLLGATIGGVLDAEGGTFRNLKSDDSPDATGDALSADGIKVTGDVFLNGKFVAEGEVRLLGAEIGGQLEVDDAWLDLLNLDSARVTGQFLWQNIHHQAECHSPNKEWKPSLNLTDAKVGPLADQEASWPGKGRLHLDGFVYDRIAVGADAKVPTDAKVPIDAAARLRWLGRQPDELGFRPQPYEQLIAVMRRMGHEHQVAKIAIAKQKDLRERGGLSRWGKFCNRFLYRTIRYGYEPWRAFIWIMLLIALGSLVFSQAHSANVLVPSDKEAYTEYEKSKIEQLPPYYPDFHAAFYSLDVVLPFDLGQKSNWRLIQRWPADRAYWAYELYSIVQLFIGWLLLIVAAAVPAGLIKKD